MTYRNWDGYRIEISDIHSDRPYLWVGKDNCVEMIGRFFDGQSASKFIKCFEQFVTITSEGDEDGGSN